uniref:DUF4218 domain-containing protein n=1 Tax=Strigamia maritima TaxID=126957 RepID=T1IH55_STRMM
MYQRQCVSIMIVSFFVGKYVSKDSECWMVYLLLRSICGIIFTQKQLPEQLSYLLICISDFLELFHHVFPEERITPKMHYITHYPRLIIQYGSLLQFWSIRFEAKHKYFKKAAAMNNCFKNICYSLAFHHQYLESYTLKSIPEKFELQTKSMHKVLWENLPECL